MIKKYIAMCILAVCPFVQGSDYLVRIKNPYGLNAFVEKVRTHNMSVTHTFELVPGLMRIQGTDAQAAALAQQPDVLYVERNHVRRPSIRQSLNLNLGTLGRPAIPAPVPRPKDWVSSKDDSKNFGISQSRTLEIFEKRKYYGSEKTIIAVLDTGVDYTHPDLKANMWRNTGESGNDDSGNPKESNGIDDDGNGFVDDVVGWDFIHKDNLPFDDYGHGTHVAGIAAAVGGNGWGISGHCPRCSIMALKFISAEGWGTDADAILGLEYAAKMGATVINSSWGSTEYSQALFDAFAETSKMGIYNAIAAGNDGKDLDFDIPNFYPAEFKLAGAYTISALYSTNISIPWWSNYGWHSSHFSMAGAGVYSCIPGGRFATFDGTSMAAPGGAGIIGLIKSYKPDLTFEQTKSILSKAILPDKDSMQKVNFGGRPDLVSAFNKMDKQ